MNETDLLHLFIQQVPFSLPDVRVFRRNIINVMTVHGQWARNGQPGQADAYAITRGGLHVELEAKAAAGKLAEAQRRWRAWCEDWAIPYLLLRVLTRETPERTVERWVENLQRVCEEHGKVTT